MPVSKRGTLVSKIILTIRVLGLWHGEKRIISILARFAIMCYLSTYILQLVALVINRHDIQRFFECFSVISFCGMGILKLYSLGSKEELWFDLLNRMSRLEQQQLKQDNDLYLEDYDSDGEGKNNQGIDYIMNYTKKFKWTSTILFKMYCFTGVIFVLTPFVEYAFEVFQGRETDVYPHILPSWNPFDDVHFSCYAVVILCEILAAIYCVCVHVAFDSTVIGVIIFVCGQFSSLIHECEQIGGSGKSYKLSRKRDMRAHFRVKKCHRDHLGLVSLINDLDKLLQNILGFYFFLATLTLCSVAVRFKTEQMSVMQLVSLLQYMCATLTQLFIYCKYGDAIYNETTITAAQGPFGAAIWCLSPKIRRELAILGLGMMRPRRLHARPFNTVDLPSFIQIVRTAYSYYAVLGNNKQTYE